MLTAGCRSATLFVDDAGRTHALALVRIDDGRPIAHAALLFATSPP